MMAANRFQYVISGTSYTTLTKAVQEQFAESDLICEMMKRLNNACDDHSIAVLFNGYTERGLAEYLHRVFKDSTDYYVDSGGLQMVTLGLESTPEKKRAVYDIQAKWGTYSMSFDEIPVRLLSDMSTRLDTKNRVFDPESFTKFAKLSGENLRDQIDYFIEQKTKSKPLLIVQGNDFAHYQQWIDIILEVVGEERWNYIGGMSMGAAALGTGELQDFQRAYLAMTLQAPEHIKNHIHLLGVGALKRMCPYISLIRGGQFKNTVISYDSTTHTRALQEATYHKGFVLQKFLYNRLKPFYQTVMPDIIKVSKEILEVDVEEKFITDCYLARRSTYVAEHGNGNDYELSRARYCALFTSVYNFTRDVEALVDDFSHFMKIDASKYLTYETFKHVRDEKDFNEWYGYNRNLIRDVGVQSSANISTLGALFA